MKSIEETHEQREQSTNERVKGLVNEIEKRRDKAKEIVGIIAGTGMAGGYKRDADEQRSAFKWWNLGTILGFVGLIGFSVWLFIESTGEGPFTWSTIAGRLIAIIAFGLFSTYAGRMAMKHRESERQHRHKQLALESVNAFLEDLEPAVQKAVKQRMAEVFFTQTQEFTATDGDVVPTTIDGLLKVLTKAIDKLGK